MKTLRTIILTLSIVLFPLLAQGQEIVVSTGGLFSKYISNDVNWKRSSIYRYSYFVRADYFHEIVKVFDLNLSISYQERIPLELFAYSHGISGGVQIGTVLSDWPTNPQNPLFDDEFYGIRFPNFKYLHLDVVPTFKVGQIVKLKVGIGPFFGILLNKEETTVTRALFNSRLHSIFNELQSDIISEYTRIDVGLVPKINVDYQINSKCYISLQSSYYLSLRRLNNTLVNRKVFLKNNMKWRAITVGLGFGYKINWTSN